MSQLPNPNSNKPFDEVLKDKEGQDQYGVRKIDGHEEIVHIPTQQSNMKYWKPEMVMNPVGCSHQFDITNLGSREIECNKCGFGTQMHLGINTTEDSSGLKISLKNKSYPINT